MKIFKMEPRNALNKAFLKVKPTRADIDRFKKNFIDLIDNINHAEYEEYHKKLVSDFLQNTYYSPLFYINTKGRSDLVIHNGKDSKSTVGVIVEAKSPTNKSEMLSLSNLNTKAFHELLLYYLRERISGKNINIRHLIATNVYQWFIFDAATFETLFANNSSLINSYVNFSEGRLSGRSTDFFYKEIAEPFLAKIDKEIPFAYFDIKDYEGVLRNADVSDDNILIYLFKLLSPENLLKLPFINDSNTLDKSFYAELLHIIGLSETTSNGRKVIQRNAKADRNDGAFIELIISQLSSLDNLDRLPNKTMFGQTAEEQLFNVSLELAITWVNRILFLKLLEAQLINYHRGDTSYAFLNLIKISSFDDLNSLFFDTLTCKIADRSSSLKKVFEKVPYLNSSLFDPTELEHSCLFIGQLRDLTIPLPNFTVLKDTNGKKRTGKLKTLEYLFEFLNAYDFSSDYSECIQEENKPLISASVIGLIFEKINGYKDGSYFTPGFITMHLCRETIRKAIISKFNETKEWKCNSIASLLDKIEDKIEANKIINSLKICDPSVGSGHFLVSSLNEIIAVKSELKILLDSNNCTLRDYHVEIVNDELTIIDDNGHFFSYSPSNPESQRVQEAIFKEKQTIIENCLFGVDINQNSVNICRLRLWIELLKNAFYKKEANNNILETLPNIDINIKSGNSLLCRYPINSDIKKALRKSKWSIDSYRLAVMTYRNAKSKNEKRDIEKLITQIKNDFETEIASTDPRAIKLEKLKGNLYNLMNQTSLSEKTKSEKAKWEKDVKRNSDGINKIEKEFQEIKNNKIYDNAFEWRFEFPEVLDDNGDFVGFDAIVGNPPYISAWELFAKDESIRNNIKTRFSQTGDLLTRHWDLYMAFMLLSFEISRKSALLSFIVPNPFLREKYAAELRKHIISNYSIESILLFEDSNVFDDVARRTIIYLIDKSTPQTADIAIYSTDSKSSSIVYQRDINAIDATDNEDCRLNVSVDPVGNSIVKKIESVSVKVGNLFFTNYGAQVSSKVKGGFKKADVISSKPEGNYKPFIEGKDVHRWHIDYRSLFLNYKKK